MPTAPKVRKRKSKRAAPATVITVEPFNPYQALNEKRLERVHPGIAGRARMMLDRCAQAGLALLITQGFRSFAEQDSLYAQGRTVPGKIVTNARAGQSYHNFGLAFDIVVLDAMGKADWNDGHPGWRFAAEVGRSVGLEWGGTWSQFKDLPHFQYSGGLTLAQCRELFGAGGLPAVWTRVR
jgi:peptidoglycan LD-endopeptidase CwlK